MSARRLNPCPFCGDRPRLPAEYAVDGAAFAGAARKAVMCERCSTQGPFVHPVTRDDNITEAQARVAWNCRSN